MNTGRRHGFLFKPLKEWIAPTIKWANGDEYKGQWKDGKRHGKGIYTRADKTILTPVVGEGCFDNDNMIGKFNETKPDGTTRIVVDPKL